MSNSDSVLSGLEMWSEEEWFHWLNHPMRKELRKIKGNRRLADPNRHLLHELSRLPNGNTKRKRALRAELDKRRIPIAFVNDVSLKTSYSDIASELDRRYRLTEAFGTWSEQRFYAVFKGESKRNIIPGAWIGPYCADLFCPSIRIGKCVGLIFEIDGGVHENEGKALKDNYRDEYFSSLGIYVMHIDNRMVKSDLIKYTLASLKGAGSADSNSIRNKWRKIEIETIAYYAAHTNISDKLGVDLRIVIK